MAIASYPHTFPFRFGAKEEVRLHPADEGKPKQDKTQKRWL